MASDTIKTVYYITRKISVDDQGNTPDSYFQEAWQKRIGHYLANGQRDNDVRVEKITFSVTEPGSWTRLAAFWELLIRVLEEDQLIIVDDLFDIAPDPIAAIQILLHCNTCRHITRMYMINVSKSPIRLYIDQLAASYAVNCPKQHRNNIVKMMPKTLVAIITMLNQPAAAKKERLNRDYIADFLQIPHTTLGETLRRQTGKKLKTRGSAHLTAEQQATILNALHNDLDDLCQDIGIQKETYRCSISVDENNNKKKIQKWFSAGVEMNNRSNMTVTVTLNR